MFWRLPQSFLTVREIFKKWLTCGQAHHCVCVPHTYFAMFLIGSFNFKQPSVVSSSWNVISISSSFSLCQCVWGAAPNVSTASSDSFSTLLCLLSSTSGLPPPAFLTSLLTLSSHLSLGLPRLLLPSSLNSRNSAALKFELICFKAAIPQTESKFK